MNAFTTHEQTVFYVRVPDTQLELAIDILADVLWSPAFRPDDVDSERQVILEEIGMRDDTPDDLVHDLFASAHFPDHPLGREVLGTEATIDGDAARRHRRGITTRTTSPPNIVFAAAGNLDARARARARSTPAVRGRCRERPARAHAEPAAARSRVAVVHRATEQAHLVLGVRSVPALDPDRYALTVVNQALGGGMSSRLFQEIRESAGSRTRCTRTAPPSTTPATSRSTPAPRPSACRRRSTVIEAELDRLVTRRALRPRSSTRPRAISRVRSRCRSRRRRAGCAASAGRSWSRARSRPSTR